MREIVSPLLDNAPPKPNEGGLRERLRTLGTMIEVGTASARHRDVLVPFYELFTGVGSHVSVCCQAEWGTLFKRHLLS